MIPKGSAPLRHLAIIMDGNGRWAEDRGLNRLAGHVQGVTSVRTAVRACRRWGLEALTLYAFSTENWLRPSPEVDGLMELLLRYLREERSEILDNGIRLIASGETERLPPATQEVLAALIGETAHNSEMVLNLALSYGSRAEITRAVRGLAEQVAAGTLLPHQITPQHLSNGLYTAALPDPDLIVRTGGDMRLSNFLLWQAAYAEIYVTQVRWPDFGEEELQQALSDYLARQRRFGRTGAQVTDGT